MNALLNEFNAVVLEDVDLGNQHVDGRVYVGRNLTGGNGSVYLNGGGAPASSFAALYVVGDVTGSVKVEQGGAAQVGGNVSGMNYQNANNASLAVGGTLSNVRFGNNNTAWVGGSASGVNMEAGSRLEVGGNLTNSTIANTAATVAGTVSNSTIRNTASVSYGAISASPLSIPDLGEISDLMHQTAEDLAGLAQTSTMTTDGSTTTFASSASGGTSVFSISGADFNALQNIKFVLQPDETLIINVQADGMALTRGQSGNMTGTSASTASQVLWNFIGASSLYTANALFGTIFAPDAHVTAGAGSNEGTVVARRLTLTNGEIHQQGWKGGLAFDTPSAPPTPTPIPAALPMLAGGLGALAALARRRRAA
ncbi:collagen-binding domain-containing protein [Albimonas pacifica]|uniref:collagen-binding domain-containing protein n=1 Tax=Albimonas pacifica TaxID=1114924 RepID=UPI0015A6E607|nr:collagen-binding domain-containing protein [Albimonas pacifica]